MRYEFLIDYLAYRKGDVVADFELGFTDAAYLVRVGAIRATDAPAKLVER